jgi:hypothetical protein
MYSMFDFYTFMVSVTEHPMICIFPLFCVPQIKLPISLLSEISKLNLIFMETMQVHNFHCVFLSPNVAVVAVCLRSRKC